MNITELKQLIRGAVREEVKSALNEYFADRDKLVESRDVRTADVPDRMSSVAQLFSGPPTPKPTKTYVKNNPVLNQILNETVVKIPRDVPLATQVMEEANGIESPVPSIPIAALPVKDYGAILKKSKGISAGGKSKLNFSTSGD